MDETEKALERITREVSCKERDIIIWGETKDWSHSSGGTFSFKELTAVKCRELLNKGFADPEDCQDSAPSFKEITEFLERNPNFTGHGYAVSPDRNDYRVTLEGVESRGPISNKERNDFVYWFRQADDFSLSDDGAFAWFD
jgi:hypothetical protein